MAQYGLEAVAPPPEGYQMLQGWADPWPSPFHKAIEVSGYGGVGIDWDILLTLWPSIPLFALFLLIGYVGKHYLFPRIAIALGASPKKKTMLRKFSYQLWLLIFYVLNTIFGYFVLRDKPFFGFPMSTENMFGLFQDFPAGPDPMMTAYFSVGLAFYFSELVSLCIEARRSDFMEYVTHHIATIILIGMGYSGRDHYMGGYILFIHDASDIFLCMAKVFHYVNYQKIVNCCFALFVSLFIFLRLVCLPTNFISCFYIAPVVRKATINFYALATLLYLVLQLLHVYWFLLIVRMIGRLIAGKTGDSRSDSDCDNDEKKVKKAKTVKSKQ